MGESDAEVLVGDGLAEVVVAHEQADKDFGNGSSTFCSVKLRVNQDDQSILAAIELASALALEQLPKLRDEARAVWDPSQRREEPRGRGRR